MRLFNKCFAVALSALFAATPVAQVNAMPLPVAKVQPAAGTGGNDIQLVRDHHRPEWRPRDRGRNWNRNREVRRDARRWDRREMRRDRRDARRWHRGERYGWHRGHRGYRHARPGYRYHNGFWFPFAAFGAGAVIGGAIANDRGYYGGGSHTRWCANRYISYRAYDNTFQPYNGPRRQCRSPYS